MKATATAKLNNLRMAPRKVRLLVDLIRGMDVTSALIQLKFSKKAAAEPMFKLLQSAIANAKHNAQLDDATLVVSTAYVDEGPTLHRWKPRAFGRASRINKRTSHVTLIVEGDVKKVEKKPKAKAAVKKVTTSKPKVDKKTPAKKVKKAAVAKKAKKTTKKESK